MVDGVHGVSWSNRSHGFGGFVGAKGQAQELRMLGRTHVSREQHTETHEHRNANLVNLVNL
jgi:hypothetical protein